MIAARSILLALAVAAVAPSVGGAAETVPANGSSGDPALSADGRFVAFTSAASNLVPGDTNGSADIFVRDLRRGTTERVSVSSTGRQANGQSGGASISANGRFVAFTSAASNLVAGGHNDVDVFVRDRVTHTTQRAAAGNNDSFGGAISANGRFVVFESWASNLVPGDTNGEPDVFVRDRVAGTIERVNVSSSGAQAAPQGDDAVDAHAAISGNGRFVVFTTVSPNLVPGDTNGDSDVFLRDRAAHTTTRVTAGSATQSFAHARSVAIGASGRFVLFQAWSGNRTSNLFVYDRTTGRVEPVSVSSSGARGNGDSGPAAAISADGRFVAFDSAASNLVARDTNRKADVFVRDRVAHTTRRIAANAGQATISAAGGVVGFWSDASRAGDVFVRDRVTGTTRLVSIGRARR